MLVDLAQCDFVDSAPIEAILQAERLLALEGRRIAVVGAKGQVLHFLTVLGLTDRRYAPERMNKETADQHLR